MRKIDTKVDMNIVPMIDVIFQLFIFFICTLDMQSQQIGQDIILAMAPHGTPVAHVDPRTIHIDIDAQGRIFIAKTWISAGTLKQVLKKAVAEYGPTIPVVLRGDEATVHGNIKAILDACSGAGLSQIRFAAIKEKQR